MNRKDINVCATINYVEHFHILAPKIIVSILISAFSPLIGIHIGIMNSVIGLKICATAAGIKKYKSIIKRKKKSMIK